MQITTEVRSSAIAVQYRPAFLHKHRNGAPRLQGDRPVRRSSGRHCHRPHERVPATNLDLAVEGPGYMIRGSTDAAVCAYGIPRLHRHSPVPAHALGGLLFLFLSAYGAAKRAGRGGGARRLAGPGRDHAVLRCFNLAGADPGLRPDREQAWCRRPPSPTAGRDLVPKVTTCSFFRGIERNLGNLGNRSCGYRNI